MRKGIVTSNRRRRRPSHGSIRITEKMIDKRADLEPPQIELSDIASFSDVRTLTKLWHKNLSPRYNMRQPGLTGKLPLYVKLSIPKEEEHWRRFISKLTGFLYVQQQSDDLNEEKDHRKKGEYIVPPQSTSADVEAEQSHQDSCARAYKTHN